MMRLKTYLFAAALVIISSCTAGNAVPEQGAKPCRIPEFGENDIEGELLVRFDESVADLLEKTGMTRSGPSSALSVCALPDVDEVLGMLDGYTIERVFPVDARTEASAVKDGLHLWYLVRFDSSVPAREVAERLSVLGEVRGVGYNRQLKKADEGKVIPLTPAMLQAASGATRPYFNDGLLPYQWHLVNEGDLGETKFTAGADVQVRKAWELSTGDPSVIVAVLDEGVDFTHPDLKAAMWVNEDEIWRSHQDNDGNGYAGDYYGYNFVTGNGIISTDNLSDSGHGSHVAGVIAAVNNNGEGISSVAGGDGEKPGVRIMSCQIFSGNSAGTLLDEVRAIKYAADNGAVILQCSWGYVSGSANAFEWTPQYATDEQWLSMNMLESLALDYFIHNAGSPDGVIEGGVAIFAGGNEAAPSAGYPGAYGDFVSVAATAADYTPSVYTNYGPGTTICAPGGDQDYYYEYGEGSETGALGCVLSTLPYHVSPSGYGYMEGTSMACPHVSGVVALGISYAAQLRKHFRAEEIIDLLYSSATPVEQFWNTDEPKGYYKYVLDLGTNHYKTMDLNSYRGKMGHGQVNAYAFLQAIGGAGVPMTFPNVYVAAGSSKSYLPSAYFVEGESLSYSVEGFDPSVAELRMEGSRLVVTGVAEGQTGARISAGNGTSFEFVVTVRSQAQDNGWL